MSEITISVGTSLSVAVGAPLNIDEGSFSIKQYHEVGEVGTIPTFGGQSQVAEFIPIKTGVVDKKVGSTNYGSSSIVAARVIDYGQFVLSEAFDGTQRGKTHCFKIYNPDIGAIYFAGVVTAYQYDIGDANNISKVNITIELSSKLVIVMPIDTIPDATFYAALNASLAPTSGIGPYLFSRSTPATVLDRDGVVQNCYAGEARFLNGIRVCNLLKNANAKTADFTDGVWIADGVTFDSPTQFTTVGTSSIAGPTATGVFSGDAQNRVFRVSFTAFKVSGTSNNLGVRLFNNGPDTAHSGTPVTLSGSPQRFSSLITVTSAAGTSLDLIMRSAASEAGRVIDCEDILIEDVTHQVNQNPAKHVSFGMGDDHGSNEDGVKWFPVENGNTVDGSYIVTEADGAPLTNTCLLLNQQKGNDIWPSNNLSHANWTKNNVTIGASATFLAGKTTQQILSDSVLDEIHSVQQSISTTALNGDMALSFFVAAGTAGFAFIRATNNADSSYATQWFNLTTGAVASSADSDPAVNKVNIQAGSGRMTPVKGGGYKVEVVIDGAAAGAHRIECGLCDADLTVTMAAAGIGEVLGTVAGFVFTGDHEVGQYIETTTAAVVVEGDLLSYPVANIPAGEWSTVVEFDYFAPTPANAVLFSVENLGETAGIYIELFGNSKAIRVSIWNSLTERVYRCNGAALSTGFHKVGFTYSPTSGRRALVVDGVEFAATEDLDDDAWVRYDFGIGTYPQVGTGQPDRMMRNIRVWNTPLTVEQLQTRTL